MPKVRIHREWFQSLAKTRCPCGRNHTKVFAWGEYVSGRWRTVDHFCEECFSARVIPRIIRHAGGCGCVFEFCARSGHSALPEWLKVPEACAVKVAS
jgi:hypothetical protein